VRWHQIVDAAKKGAGMTHELESGEAVRQSQIMDATTKGAGTTHRLETEGVRWR
jgi:hypothetical protein